MAEERSGHYTRRRIATLILIKMLDSQGDPSRKVDAAVMYTDALLNRLKTIRQRGQNPDDKNKKRIDGENRPAVSER